MKLDIERAYNKVKCMFIQAMLETFTFWFFFNLLALALAFGFDKRLLTT